MTVTVDALSTMLHAQGIGELPVAIRPGPVWRDPDGNRDAEAAAWTEFREVGWVDRDGRLVTDAQDSLHVVAHPALEYTAIIVRAGRQHVVVVAARGDDSVVIRREGGAVTLSGQRRQSLPETLLRQIPDARPAPIDALNVRSADAPGALVELSRRRLVGQGELYVGMRDRYGRVRVSDPIRYQDYEIGRVVVVISGDYVSVAPATKALLLARLNEDRLAIEGA
ncbi:MAG TPA: ESX secretion-associated protein EspG [Pseudonocardiaceae bacterium]|nr:ESX secretion-associated protein EspG [Pseudonocardiaceae bacterium]